MTFNMSTLAYPFFVCVSATYFKLAEWVEAEAE